MTEMACKCCNSSNIVKFGTRKGTQYYFCKDCKRKFVPDTLPKMKTPTKIVASALGQYYGGMPLDSIQRQLQQDYNLSMSEVGIYKWVVRFSQQAVKQAKTFKPKVGEVWLADETVLKVGGKNMWFWDLIDEKTRFLLASRLSYSRTTKDAEALMQQAYERAGKAPKTIVTDKLAAYLDGIERVFGADTEHIQTSPFGNDGESTSIIERFHGTLKERTDIVRGFKNPAMAKLLTDAWLVHYNFFKEHTTLGDIPPAQKMGIAVPFEDWNGVLKTVQETTIKPALVERIAQPKPYPKRRHSRLHRRKPKPTMSEVSRSK
jgi:putative transposase